MNDNQPPPGLDDTRPLVASEPSNRGLWIFGGLLGVSALGLFAALEARRGDQAKAMVIPSGENRGALIASPPDLAIPPDYQGSAYPGPQGPYAVRQVPLAPYALPQPRMASGPRGPVMMQQAVPSGYSSPLPSYTSMPSQPAGPAVVYKAPDMQIEARETPGSGEAVKTGNRTLAGKLANPSMTVPQGVVVQAVLESALDSTRAGFARAIVSRDVRGFDGSRVLIPRGSRLIGNYKPDLAQGQKRAFIQWERLIRPDGATIAVNSPAADPLGRAGLGGKVNTHFFERFGGAILQSTLDIGVAAASRRVAGDSVVVALPGSAVTNTTKDLAPTDIKPTLKVRQGTSVSVFVARDLDFSSVEQ